MPADKHANRRAAKALIGTTIQKRYHVVRLLGDGGMGAVYKAADTVLRRFVAIKLLHAGTAENPSAVERFVREARSSAAIGHPNIIDVLDFGYEGKRPYLVMEYLRGRSLSEAIHEERQLSMARACNIATHSLAGLAAAHDRGILHRDLKPANMMLIALLGDRDFVKLCDFGFAALIQPSVRIDGGKAALTPTRTLVGTLVSMSGPLASCSSKCLRAVVLSTHLPFGSSHGKSEKSRRHRCAAFVTMCPVASTLSYRKHWPRSGKLAFPARRSSLRRSCRLADA